MESEFSILAFLDGFPLDVKTLEITLDDSWSPYCQARMTVARPTDLLLEQIDPRAKKQVSIYLFQKFGIKYDPTLAFYSQAFGGQPVRNIPGGVDTPTIGGLTARLRTAPPADITRYFRLGLRERRLGHVAGELDLTLHSDEAILNTGGLVANTPHTSASAYIRDIVADTLSLMGVGPLAPGPGFGRVPDDAHTWQPGVSAWDFLTPILQNGGARLWCDELQVWRLDPAEKTRPETLALSHLENITDPTDTISLDGLWYDAVVITYEWTDGANERQTRYDTAKSSPVALSVLNLKYETVYPGPGAAARILNRVKGRGREFAIRAISDLTASPGMQTRIDLEDTPTQSGYVTSITWSYPADEMEVKTRELSDTPLTAWIFAPSGLSWNDVPAGMKWADFTPELGA